MITTTVLHEPPSFDTLTLVEESSESIDSDPFEPPPPYSVLDTINAAATEPTISLPTLATTTTTSVASDVGNNISSTAASDATNVLQSTAPIKKDNPTTHYARQRSPSLSPVRISISSSSSSSSGFRSRNVRKTSRSPKRRGSRERYRKGSCERRRGSRERYRKRSGERRRSRKR